MLSKVVGLSTAQIMTYHMKFIDGKICNGYTCVLFSYRADKFLDGLLYGVVTVATWIDRSYSRGMHYNWSKRSNGILMWIIDRAAYAVSSNMRRKRRHNLLGCVQFP